MSYQVKDEDMQTVLGAVLEKIEILVEVADEHPGTPMHDKLRERAKDLQRIANEMEAAGA